MSDQDRQMFDAALSDAPIEVDEAPASPAVEPATPEMVTQPRDENGRFATKTLEVQPQAEQPPMPSSAPQPARAEEAATIPAWRLSEVTQERNQLRQQNADLNNRLSALESRVNAKPAEPEAPPPEPWDPGYTEYVQSKTVAQIEQRYEASLQALAKDSAVARHTEEAVNAAEQAFMEAIRNRTLDPADFNRVKSAPNRYSAAVEWHKRNQTLQTVGSDPNAWFEQELTRRMADPAFAAKLGTPQPPAAQQQPSNVIELPPSLSRIGTAPSPDAAVEMNSASMFRAALS